MVGEAGDPLAKQNALHGGGDLKPFNLFWSNVANLPSCAPQLHPIILPATMHLLVIPEAQRGTRKFDPMCSRNYARTPNVEFDYCDEDAFGYMFSLDLSDQGTAAQRPKNMSLYLSITMWLIICDLSNVYH